jgi:hypothetical protein
LQALKDYQKLIAEVDSDCRRIVSRHKDQIACTKGCAGNCCRIHISVYPVEAVSLALALQELTPEMRRRIQHKARHTNSFGHCPLLEDGASRMYVDLAQLNNTLAAINRRFVSEAAHRLPPGDRFTLAQALVMDI